MPKREYIYRTPASTLVAGWTWRDMGVDLTITKVYNLSDGKVVVHDSSGMTHCVPGATLFDIISDN